MDELRDWSIRLLVGLFTVLLLADMIDGLVLGNRWAGCPTELFGIIGAIVGGLFTVAALSRKNGNGKPKSEGG